ncbi:phosphoribosylformylglycinamidine cyclo-ligase [Paenibacillus larvae]
MSEAYKQAGVNIAAGNEAVERIKRHVLRTSRPGMLSGFGGFCSLFSIEKDRYEEPVLVSGTDGVGTKLKLAFAMDRHDTIGIDAVAMCVNDVVVQGAEPLFFLDYLACGKVVPEKIEKIVAGIAEGCVQAGCGLIGGETAEMPGMYADGDYDIAGFTVGIADRPKIIDGSAIRPGDVVLGLPSSGLHSNGFSLVRKLLLEDKRYSLDEHMEELRGKLGDVLLTPTRIYVKTVLKLVKELTVKGMAHITGGGFIENIPRILPEDVDASIMKGSWPVHPIFQFIEREGQISQRDMYTTFNMGIGLVLVVPAEEGGLALKLAGKLGEKMYRIGTVTEGNRKVKFAGPEELE